jgi:hypothetical protein
VSTPGLNAGQRAEARHWCFLTVGDEEQLKDLGVVVKDDDDKV